MFLVGMWHQQPTSGWNFVIYANLHGGAMLFNRWNRLRDREAPLVRRLPWWLLGAALVAGGFFVFGSFVLELGRVETLTLAGFAGVVFVLLVALPETGGRWNTVAHVFITFQFTVVSRIFFRADDFSIAKKLSAKVVGWDFRGVRPGLFRIPWWTEWCEGTLAEAVPGLGYEIVYWVGEHGMLLVLIGGLAYHWTPRRWVDEVLRDRFCRLPGPAIGIAFALLALCLMTLLEGPRANIYFAF
jgi:hypothetical protein